MLRARAQRTVAAATRSVLSSAGRRVIGASGSSLRSSVQHAVHKRAPLSQPRSASLAHFVKDRDDGPSTSAPDAPPPPSWVDKYAPASVQPYLKLARVDRPIGTWLLLWPCLWSTALCPANGAAIPDLKLLALFSAGAFIMRGAGCTINDMWDREIDDKVSRTRSRPLAAGVVSMKQAAGFLTAQLLAGLGILLQLNPYTCVRVRLSAAVAWLIPCSVPFYLMRTRSRLQDQAWPYVDASGCAVPGRQARVPHSAAGAGPGLQLRRPGRLQRRARVAGCGRAAAVVARAAAVRRGSGLDHGL